MATSDFAAQQIAQSNEERRPVRFDAQTNCVCIGHYEIDLDLIICERDLIGWVLQISDKTWATADTIRDFVQIVSNIRGWVA